MYICIYRLTDKDCVLVHDRPVLSTGGTPHDKTSTVMIATKIWS
jgi:hypothetical protein